MTLSNGLTVLVYITCGPTKKPSCVVVEAFKDQPVRIRLQSSALRSIDESITTMACFQFASSKAEDIQRARALEDFHTIKEKHVRA